MRNHLYSVLFILLCVSAGLCWVGCDGDDDSSDTTVVVTNAPAPAAPQTLKTGDVTIPDGGVPLDAATVVAPGDGKLVAVVTWAEAVDATAWFVKGADPAELGEVTGDSPLTSTVNGVNDGDAYTLRLRQMDPDPIAASYTITFDPD